jgi:arylsulfate sulfotransferase
MKNNPDSKVLLAGGLFLYLLTFACGGGGGTTTTTLTSVPPKLTPKTALLLTGQTQIMTFTPGSAGASSVTWTVNGVAGGDSTVGTVDTSGIYTAPAVPPSPNNSVTVKATNASGSAQAVFTIENPAPSVASLTPVAAIYGSSDTLITVSGAGFTPQSLISAGGTALATTVVSNSELTANLPAAALATVAVTQVTVSTPGPGGGTSSPLPFTTLWSGVDTTNNPQVAAYGIAAPRLANVTIEFGPDTSYGLKTWTRPTDTNTGAVSIYVAGMKAFTTYHMRAIVDFPDGTQFLDADHTFTTGGLPSYRIPPVTVTNYNGLTPASGVEILNVVGASPSAGTTLPPDQNPVWADVFDTQGNLIWYFDYDPTGQYGGGVAPIKLLPNGDILAKTVPGLWEADLAGNTVHFMNVQTLNTLLAYYGFKADVSDFSHDFAILPNGHLVVNTIHYKTFSSLPGFPVGVTVEGDYLVDLDQNWNPVWTWDTFDHLDVNRRVFGFPDWTHGNAVIYSPDDGNLVYSMRNQSWVIKIDYENGQGNGNVLWRFGNQGDFTLDAGAPAAWQYGQHYPIFLSPNSTGKFRLGVFDDGNFRVMDDAGDTCGTTGQPACYSRIPIYDVDESAKTVHVEWEDKTDPLYSPFLGSMQILNNGNVEFDSGAVSQVPPAARIMEVTQQTPPVPVWEMDVNGYFVYRALRIPSLYPGVQW